MKVSHEKPNYRQMKHLLIGAYCLIFILSACNTSGKSTVEVDENGITKLSIDPMSTHDDQFSDLIEDVSLIQLETSTESLIGEIGKIEIKGDKIFIQDRSLHEIKIFNMDGTYLGKISNKHQGPGGYNDIWSFSASKNGELIEIYDNRGFKFRTYNLNNEFVEDFSIDYLMSDFMKLENDKKVVYSGFLPSYNMDGFPNSSRLLFANKSEVYQSAFEYVYSESNPIRNVVGGFRNLSYYGDTIVLGAEILSFDIYHIFEDSIKKKYQIDFGDEFMPPINMNASEEEIENYLKSNLRYEYAKISLVLESSQHLFVKYSVKKSMYFFLFDKTNGKVYNLQNSFDHSRRIDISVPEYIWNDTFVGITHAEYYKLVFDIYKKQGIDPPPFISEIDSNINENSNPVLSLIKFKPS